MPLSVNHKGLFTVDLSRVLEVFATTSQKKQVLSSCEVVTFACEKIFRKPT